MAESLTTRAKKIRLLGMDVDGVLTRGEVVVLESGEEVKFWNAKDRLGLALIRDEKVPLIIAWMTGRKSRAVTNAARDLGVRHVFQKCRDKRKAMLSLLSQYKLSAEQAAFIGDDLIDLSVMRLAGFSACPCDAVPDVRARADYVSDLRGGEGVVRDVCEFILKAQGRWDSLLKKFQS